MADNSLASWTWTRRHPYNHDHTLTNTISCGKMLEATLFSKGLPLQGKIRPFQLPEVILRNSPGIPPSNDATKLLNPPSENTEEE